MNAIHCNLLDGLLEKLRAERGRLTQVARDSGVPYSTLSKLVQGQVTNPQLSTVQALLDYFARQEGRTCDCGDPIEPIESSA